MEHDPLSTVSLLQGCVCTNTAMTVSASRLIPCSRGVKLTATSQPEKRAAGAPGVAAVTCWSLLACCSS